MKNKKEILKHHLQEVEKVTNEILPLENDIDQTNAEPQKKKELEGWYIMRNTGLVAVANIVFELYQTGELDSFLNS